ncbi:hypothetical protein STAQ_12280 [Allostella sp. ATCC 35155]|nr:hypothetical protein STAQ_12280 [Stella sp. ATCC 35155]
MSGRPAVLRTARLQLRPPLAADVRRTVEALGDWSVAQWLQRTPFPYAEADARAFLLQPPRPLPERWTVAAAGDDRLLGLLTIERAGEGREVGYWLHPDARRHGYMAEALTGLVDWLGPREPDCTLFAVVDTENAASCAVLRRCGFRIAERWRLEQPGRRGSSDRVRFVRTLRSGGKPG